MSSYPCQVPDSITPPVTYARLNSSDENVVGNYLSSHQWWSDRLCTLSDVTGHSVGSNATWEALFDSMRLVINKLRMEGRRKSRSDRWSIPNPVAASGA